MTRHLRPRSLLCPTWLAAISLAILPASSTPFAAAPLSEIQQVAAARGAEALDTVEAISRTTWPKFEPEGLALLVLQPGRWAVLLNHPEPPGAFKPAGEIARRKISPEDPDMTPWSVHLATGAVGWDDLARPHVTLQGKQTAVVRFNEVGIPRSHAAGWPPAEAAVTHMVRALWGAHRAASQPPRAYDVMPWMYQASAGDVAMAAIEQRLLTIIGRMIYNEKTLDEYERLLRTWLAVRKARKAANPDAVAMEEAVEEGEGLADFMETTTFRVTEKLGAAERPHLESVDPFFERYRSFFLLRLHLLNYPMLWYPSDPGEGLVQARARGALLAYVVYPVAQTWHEGFFGADGRATTWQAIVEGARFRGTPAGQDTEAFLLDEAKRSHGFERLSQLISAQMKERQEAARVEEAPDGRLQVRLEGRPLQGYEAAGLRFTWLGPGRVRVEGPAVLRFDGGELRVGRGREMTLAARGSGKELRLAEVSLSLTREPRLEINGKPEPWPEGRRERAREGSGVLEGDGFRAEFTGGRITLGQEDAVLEWPPAR